MVDVDVEFVEEVKNDIESLKAIQAEYPDVFGGSKRDLRFILLCLYHKAIEKHDGPRKVMPETLEPGRAKYYDPALRLSHDEVKQFMGKNLELHHDGQILDARFIGHKIINGRALALALCKAETPQKAAIADRIGPDKEFKGVSISASWEIAKDRSVTKDAKAGNVALTPDPFYPTYVYFAASSEAVEREDLLYKVERILRSMDSKVPPPPTIIPSSSGQAVVTPPAAGTTQSPPTPAVDPKLVQLLIDAKIDATKFQELLKRSNDLVDTNKTYEQKLKEKEEVEKKLKEAQQFLSQLNSPKRDKLGKVYDEAVQRLKLAVDENARKQIVGLVDSPDPAHQALATMIADYGDIVMNDVNAKKVVTAPPVVTDQAIRQAAQEAGFTKKRPRSADDVDERETEKLAKTGDQEMEKVKVEASSTRAMNSLSDEEQYKALLSDISTRYQKIVNRSDGNAFGDLIGTLKNVKQ